MKSLSDIMGVEPNAVGVTLTVHTRVWEFPYDRFIEYEPSDEAWARPLGFGREVLRPETLKFNGQVRLDPRTGSLHFFNMP